MKKIILFFTCVFVLMSCTETDEGRMTILEYSKDYENRLETIIVMAPDTTGAVSILKYENVKHKNIKIRENSVTFPDSTDHYITFINCPIVLINH